MINIVDNNNGVIMNRKFWSITFKTGVGFLAIFGIFSMIQNLKKEKNDIVDNKNDYLMMPNAVAQGTPFKVTLLQSQKMADVARNIVPFEGNEGKKDCTVGNFFADRRTKSQPNNVFCRVTEGMIIKKID